VTVPHTRGTHQQAAAGSFEIETTILDAETAPIASRTPSGLSPRRIDIGLTSVIPDALSVPNSGRAYADRDERKTH
jgi:hypothetical protein